MLLACHKHINTRTHTHTHITLTNNPGPPPLKSLAAVDTWEIRRCSYPLNQIYYTEDAATKKVQRV